MWWLTWRQHRLQVFALSAAAAAFGAYLVLKAWPMIEPTRLSHACTRGSASEEACTRLFDYVGVDSGLTVTLAAANLLPALVGVFWGAPLLAREFERGTHRLAWGQTVTRRRWLAVKLAGLAAAAVLLGAAQSALLTWATGQFLVTGQINRFQDRTLFDLVGVVPPLLWLLALLIGVTVGMFVRRTVAAMAVTLVVFGAVLLGLNVVRPHYATPEARVTVTWVGGDVFQAVEASTWKRREDWILADRPYRPDGRAVSPATAERLCPGSEPPMYDRVCLAQQGIEMREVYHPESRFWRFQWTEAGIIFTATALLSGFILIRIRRRAD